MVRSEIIDVTHNLRQVERVVSNGVEDQVLEFIHSDQEILA